ncbi:hypothetical protein BV898_13622 [Hypsibius exemplaris]|uniref:Copper transport protein n=1 Tax=Hypsibius exemplaris TaxID=2072580 RepID=A0A1W0WA30_HYPEX|nr:hypothetical protein BV898_13622 [Hypsibius exemplaris]
MEMPMYFGTEFPSYLLFFDWAPRRDSELVWSSFIIFGIAVILEGIRRAREIIRVYDLRDLKLMDSQKSCCVNLDCGNEGGSGGGGNGLRSIQPGGTIRPKLRLLFRRFHLLQTFLLGVQTVLGYFLMLAAMTYNVWIFVAMVVGTVAGHFFFSWTSA